MILSKTEQADVHIWTQHDLLTPELTIPHSIELHLWIKLNKNSRDVSDKSQCYLNFQIEFCFPVSFFPSKNPILLLNNLIESD